MSTSACRLDAAKWRARFIVIVMTGLAAASISATTPISAEERPAVLFVADRQHGSPEFIRTWDDWLEEGFEIDAKPNSQDARSRNLP